MHSLLFFFFNDTATTEIYTLSLHDALPICEPLWPRYVSLRPRAIAISPVRAISIDRKSTRLNSGHVEISYAVFCLKKKKIGIFRERNIYQKMRVVSQTLKPRIV